MEQEERVGAIRPLAERALGIVGKCLRKGCVVCIEHTPSMAPRFSPWRLWGQPSCYNGDADSLYGEIDRCRRFHGNHHIRLNIEDFSCHSRFSVIVHNPAVQPA